MHAHARRTRDTVATSVGQPDTQNRCAAPNINNITFPDSLFFRKTRQFSCRPSFGIFRNPNCGGETEARVPPPPENRGRRPKFLRAPPCRFRTDRSAASISIVPLFGRRPPTTITRGVGRRPPANARRTLAALPTRRRPWPSRERMFDRAPRSHCNAAAVATRRRCVRAPNERAQRFASFRGARRRPGPR